MITRLASKQFLFLLTSKYGSKCLQINRLRNLNMSMFSSGKKQKKLQKAQMKRKSYNLDGIDKNKLPEHLKTAFELKRQTQNMEVVSEAELQNEVIVSQIKKQREEIQTQSSPQQIKQIKISETEKLLLGLSAINVGIYGFLYLPILSNHMFWLGVYSSAILYPSLIFTTSISIGINLAYLILRQGLFMHEKTQEIKKIDLTSAPFSLYLQMLLVSMQFFSLATSVSIPLTLLGMSQNYKTFGLYAILFCLLSVNAHLTLQKRLFISRFFHISSQAGCFAILFLLSAFCYLQYNMEDENGENQDKKNFIRGQNKFKSIWRIEKNLVIKNQKITDLLLNLDQTQEAEQISK